MNCNYSRFVVHAPPKASTTPVTSYSHVVNMSKFKVPGIPSGNVTTPNLNTPKYLDHLFIINSRTSFQVHFILLRRALMHLVLVQNIAPGSCPKYLSI